MYHWLYLQICYWHCLYPPLINASQYIRATITKRKGFCNIMYVIICSDVLCKRTHIWGVVEGYQFQGRNSRTSFEVVFPRWFPHGAELTPGSLNSFCMQQQLHAGKPLQLAGKPGESSRQFQTLENFDSLSPIAWFLTEWANEIYRYNGYEGGVSKCCRVHLNIDVTCRSPGHILQPETSICATGWRRSREWHYPSANSSRTGLFSKFIRIHWWVARQSLQNWRIRMRIKSFMMNWKMTNFRFVYLWMLPF